MSTNKMKLTTSLLWNSLTGAAFFLGSLNSFATDIQWNGFGSVYYGQAFNGGFLNSGFSTDKVDFTDFSLMGLNITGQLTDDLSFAGQIIAQGQNTTAASSFNLNAQWAFINYRPNDTYQIKVGRQLYPVSLVSEYVSVGYLLPYQSLPPIIHTLIPYNAFDGISLARFFDTSAGKLKAELFGGAPVFSLATSAQTGNYTINNLYGAALTLDGDSYQAHLSASTEMEEGSGGGGPAAYNYSSHAEHYSLGLKFEKNGFVSWTEFVLFYTPDAVTIPTQPYGPNGPTPGGKFLGFGQGAYSLLGYRIGKFMPRYTFTEGRFLAGIFNGSEEVHTFGLNYQVRPQAIIKAEYNLDVVTAGRSFTSTQSYSNPPTIGSDVLIGVDFIF